MLPSPQWAAKPGPLRPWTLTPQDRPEPTSPRCAATGHGGRRREPWMRVGTAGTIREFPRKPRRPGTPSHPGGRGVWTLGSPAAAAPRESVRGPHEARVPTLSQGAARGPRPAAELTVLLVVKHWPPRRGRRHGRAHPLFPLAPRKQGARLRAGIACVPGPELTGGGRRRGRGRVGATGARAAEGRRAGGRRGAAAPTLRATPHRRA